LALFFFWLLNFLVTDVTLQRVNTHLSIVLLFKVELWCCLRVFKFEIFGLEVGFGIKSLSKEVSKIAWLSLTDCEYTTTCWVWTIIAILKWFFWSQWYTELLSLNPHILIWVQQGHHFEVKPQLHVLNPTPTLS